MNMSFEKTFAALGEPCSSETVQKRWPFAMAVMPAAIPEFLRDEYVREARAYCGLEEADEPLLLGAADRIRRTPALLAFAWYVFWRLFVDNAPADGGEADKWPKLQPALGDQAGCLYVLAALGWVPLVRLYHRTLGVADDAVTRNTCLQVGSFVDNHKRATGRLGIFSQITWLQHYLHQPYFRIGRLEFWKKPNEPGPEVFRRRGTLETLALAPDGIAFSPEGLIDPPESAVGWRSALVRTADTVTGTPISPEGRAENRTITLALADWECILKPGDMILDMHIPAGGRMTLEACAESFRGAKEFFARQFPCMPARAIICRSWIFSPNLPEFLPPDSNLVRFMEECHTFPIGWGRRSGLWFVFFQDKFDPATVPRRSRLQRAMAEHLEKGGDLRAGGMFYMLDDVGRFGTRLYRGAGRARL
ncbi:MAG: DUF5596 domain-containing protein [Lentisphaerae bacterium]|nr:DUF5596 domain-containing protein [Lentisphaerota bacterium]